MIKYYKSKNRDISSLISDCKNYGTLPFSILAEYVCCKKFNVSLKNLKILDNQDLNAFIFFH